MNFAEEKSDFREKWRFEKNLYYYKSSKDTEDSEWEWKLFQILKVKQKILIMKKILRKDLADSLFVYFIILFRFRSSMPGLLYKEIEIVINWSK